MCHLSSPATALLGLEGEEGRAKIFSEEGQRRQK